MHSKTLHQNIKEIELAFKERNINMLMEKEKKWSCTVTSNTHHVHELHNSEREAKFTFSGPHLKEKN